MKAERHHHVVAVPVEQVEFKFPEAALLSRKPGFRNSIKGKYVKVLVQDQNSEQSRSNGQESQHSFPKLSRVNQKKNQSINSDNCCRCVNPVYFCNQPWLSKVSLIDLFAVLGAFEVRKQEKRQPCLQGELDLQHFQAVATHSKRTNRHSWLRSYQETVKNTQLQL